MKSIHIAISLVLILVWTPYLCAEDNTCWLTAPLQDDVWVIVYDADADGNRGDVIWEGKIQKICRKIWGEQSPSAPEGDPGRRTQAAFEFIYITYI